MPYGSNPCLDLGREDLCRLDKGKVNKPAHTSKLASRTVLLCWMYGSRAATSERTASGKKNCPV